LRLSRFHWHDLGSASLGLPLGSMVYWLTAEPQPGGNLRPKRLRSLGPYVRRSYQPFAFSPWPPIDCSTGQEPTATFWSSSGYRSCDRQIHTPLTSRGGGLSGLCHRTYPGIPLVAESPTLDTTPAPSNWWLPLAFASNLYHLPIAFRFVLGHLGADVCCICLSSTGRRPH